MGCVCTKACPYLTWDAGPAPTSRIWHVGPSGAVTGVDMSEAMIANARRCSGSSDLPVTFETADAMALGFADGSFDRCRAERLLMHVPDPVQALAEMVRVTKSHGRVCVFDFDWDTFVIDSPRRDITRQVVSSFSDSIRNGWIGRQLRRRFLDLGMTEVAVVTQEIFVGLEFLRLLIGGHLTQAQQSGAFAAAELQDWWAGLRVAEADGRFLAGFTAFIVSGSKG